MNYLELFILLFVWFSIVIDFSSAVYTQYDVEREKECYQMNKVR